MLGTHHKIIGLIFGLISPLATILGNVPIILVVIKMIFCGAVAAAGLSKSGSSFSANIIKILYLFIRKFCSSFSRKCYSLLYV